jgi:uncharacterized protein with FMN-binding domain
MVDSLMLDRLKKIVLSLSVVVLFALYALQQKTQSSVDSSTVDSAYVTTVTPSGAANRSTVTPGATSTATTEPPPPTASVKSATGSATQPAATATTKPSVPTRTATCKLTATSQPQGQYADGTYTGSVADANWGNVEVQAVITNGQISDVQFLQYPNHRNRSREINDQAMPLLTQEAIQSQQADVDVITGATDTSYAFIQSLATALQQAKA